MHSLVIFILSHNNFLIINYYIFSFQTVICRIVTTVSLHSSMNIKKLKISIYYIVYNYVYENKLL